MTSKETKAYGLLHALSECKDKWGDSKFPRAKVWIGDDSVRVYTGHGSEFVAVSNDGFENSKTNMTWGRDLDEAQEVAAAAIEKRVCGIK